MKYSEFIWDTNGQIQFNREFECNNLRELEKVRRNGPEGFIAEGRPSLLAVAAMLRHLGSLPIVKKEVKP